MSTPNADYLAAQSSSDKSAAMLEKSYQRAWDVDNNSLVLND